MHWTITDTAGNKTECCSEITVNEYVGISALSEYGIKIYPNPANNTLNLNLTGFENLSGLYVELINPTGITVKKTEIFSQSTVIDISNLPSGIYLLKISDNNQITGIEKIVVE